MQMIAIFNADKDGVYMNGIGLVFAGGGGKGAYQIGVWKYLRECGLTNYIRGVSGTSVGSLNAALFTTGDFKKAAYIWENIAPHQILSPRKISWQDIQIWLLREGISSIPRLLLGVAAVPVVALQRVLTDFAKVLSIRHFFSRTGLIKIMNAGVDFNLIQGSSCPCYATCFNLSSLQLERFDLRNYSAEDIQTILLASSAIPIVFDSEKFQGSSYYDGGLPFIGDNVPVAPLYNLGFRDILVVHLSQDSVIDHSQFPNARFIEIVPSVDLGGPIKGTLDFTSKGAAWRIQRGYEDAEAIIAPLVEIAKTQRKNELVFQAFLESERVYQSNREALACRKKELEYKKATDGFSEMCQDLGIDD